MMFLIKSINFTDFEQVPCQYVKKQSGIENPSPSLSFKVEFMIFHRQTRFLYLLLLIAFYFQFYIQTLKQQDFKEADFAKTDSILISSSSLIDPCFIDEFNNKPQTNIILLNGHSGLDKEMLFTFNLLNLNVTRYNSRSIGNYQTDESSDLLNLKGLGFFFCNIGAKIVIVSDINLDSWFLLKFMSTNPACSIKKVIIHSTNRVDFGVTDLNQRDQREKYLKLISTSKNVMFIANNPFEQAYTYHHNIPIQYSEMIRPFGFSSIPKQKVQNKPCTYNHWGLIGFSEILTSNGIDHELLPHEYGGPETLLGCRVFLDIPYQPSTMKIYENMARGVVSYIPSRKFMKTIISENMFPSSLHYVKDYINDLNNPDMLDYFEYYGDFVDCVYFYGGWKELKKMVEKDDVDPLNVSEKGREFMKKSRKLSEEGWKRILM